MGCNGNNHESQANDEACVPINEQNIPKVIPASMNAINRRSLDVFLLFNHRCFNTPAKKMQMNLFK